MASKSSADPKCFINTEFKKYYSNPDVTYKTFTLTGEQDHLNALASLLDVHEIEYQLSGNGTSSGYAYDTQENGSLSYEQALSVSTDQPKGKLVHVLFEPEAALSTPLTYDITAWSLPYAYGLDAVASTKAVNTQEAITKTPKRNTISKTAAGYISKWNSMTDARFLSALLQAKIKVRFSEKPFTNSGVAYPSGSLIVTRSDNPKPDFDTKLEVWIACDDAGYLAYNDDNSASCAEYDEDGNYKGFTFQHGLQILKNGNIVTFFPFDSGNNYDAHCSVTPNTLTLEILIDEDDCSEIILNFIRQED